MADRAGEEKIMTGVELIAQERNRQVAEEGWTPEHDDQHSSGEMLGAAQCYMLGTIYGWAAWPWDAEWWKPKDHLRNLVKAGALIAAEIDRLQRRGSNG